MLAFTLILVTTDSYAGLKRGGIHGGLLLVQNPLYLFAGVIAIAILYVLLQLNKDKDSFIRLDKLLCRYQRHVTSLSSSQWVR